MYKDVDSNEFTLIDKTLKPGLQEKIFTKVVATSKQIELSPRASHVSFFDRRLTNSQIEELADTFKESLVENVLQA